MRLHPGLFLLLVLAGACRTTEDMQRDYAKTLMPTTVQAVPVATSDAEPPGRAGS